MSVHVFLNILNELEKNDIALIQLNIRFYLSYAMNSFEFIFLA